MKRLSLVLLTAASALFSLPAFTATGPAVITWARATTYTDGSALAPSVITGHGVICTLTPIGGVAAPCAFSPTSFAGNVLTGTTTVTYPPEGARACFQLTTRTAAGESDPSTLTAASCKDFPALKPNPPTNVIVTVTVSVNVSVNGEPALAMTETVERSVP